ncbi:putative ATPase, AAA-type, core, P-loop containing nucleoside triphosphate hydrolase [Helianthus annuus]|nr:putative ATPase, AAA-type, core, P-loop containing nucleoside triphosphate hydrolase [Helianthus annuus]
MWQWDLNKLYRIGSDLLCVFKFFLSMKYFFYVKVSCGDVNALLHLMWQSVFEQNIPHWVRPFTYVKVFSKYEVCFYVKVTRVIYNFFASITLSGGSEENISKLFSKAYKTAPSIVFIDEIDAIASKRGNLGREMERRIVTQLMTCMGDHKRGYVLVIGATNRPDAIDPALRRTGCFDREFKLGVPDEVARIEILSALTQNIKLEGAFDLIKVARSTRGFVGADLEALVKKAGGIAMHRIFERKLEHSRKNEGWWRKGYCWTHEEIANCTYTMSDFEVS